MESRRRGSQWKGQSWASAGGGRYEVKTGTSYLFEGLRYSPTVCPVSFGGTWRSKSPDTFFTLWIEAARRSRVCWQRTKLLTPGWSESRGAWAGLPTIFREDVYFPRSPTEATSFLLTSLSQLWPSPPSFAFSTSSISCTSLVLLFGFPSPQLSSVHCRSNGGALNIAEFKSTVVEDVSLLNPEGSTVKNLKKLE